MLRRAHRACVFLLVLACVVIACAGSAQADIAMDVTNQGTVGFNGNWTLGYEFTANTTMNLTHLGFFDRDQDGLAQSHNVAIWDTAGNLIVTTTVGNSDPLIGYFHYAPIPSVALNAGQNYVIGAYDYTPDDAIRSDLGGTTLSISSDISIVTGRWVGGGSLSFPTNTVNSSVFYPTVSFQYTTSVPEPGQSAYVILACGLCWRRRRYRMAPKAG